MPTRPPASRLHPDDAHLLWDWLLYGPRDPRIGHLVSEHADAGVRLEVIEAAIVEFLENWSPERAGAAKTDNNRS